MRDWLPAVALLVPLVLVGCAQTELAPTSTTPTELDEGDHAAGTYTYSPFEPRIQITLPNDGWSTFHLIPDFFDVATETEDGLVAVMFLDPIAFLTPQEQDIQPASPQEAIGLLAAHDGATVSEPRPVEIGGLPGLEVDASYAIDNTHVIRVSGGNIGFGPSNELRLAVLEAGEGLLVIVLNCPAGHMAQAEELTQAVRESIRIH